MKNKLLQIVHNKSRIHLLRFRPTRTYFFCPSILMLSIILSLMLNYLIILKLSLSLCLVKGLHIFLAEMLFGTASDESYPVNNHSYNSTGQYPSEKKNHKLRQCNDQPPILCVLNSQLDPTHISLNAREAGI